ncbi:MAG: acetyl-CoA carboxylase biotin carboxyl carrier protein subunit [Bacteroidales bacterium]|jgi:biotin carboxyl carrier protein|nr:acetyl-CoA carboxylase biotin carboxyl carrier protein subunit [Bacteroidales bacterium]
MKTYNFKIYGNKYAVEVGELEENTIEVNVNGTPYKVELDMELKPKKVSPVVKVSAAAPAAQAGAPAQKVAPAAPTGGGGTLTSPLPGTVLDVFVKPGDAVKVGQRMLLLEAMKMENNIDADRDGVVKEVKVSKSDAVMEGQVLVVFE